MSAPSISIFLSARKTPGGRRASRAGPRSRSASSAAPSDVPPDLVFLRRDRKGLLSDRGLEGPPDLVVEVASPSTRDRDRTVKRDRYLRFGVGEYWIVDPVEERIEVHRPDAEPTDHERSLLWRPHPEAPALEIDVPSLFRGFE